MRHLRMLPLTLVACAVAAVFASAASAALPEFGVTPNKITLKSGAGELVGALTIKCKTDKGSGEVTGAKTTKVTVDFEGCTVLGIAANSEGDASGIILVAATGELCYLKGSTKAAPKVGLYSTLPAAVKIVSAGVKSEVKGSVIGEVLPLNKKSLTGTVEFAKANQTECFPENEGKGTAKKHTLEAKTGSGAFAKAEEVTKEEVTFEKEEEVKA